MRDIGEEIYKSGKPTDEGRDKCVIGVEESTKERQKAIDKEAYS
jgi:hypothetical protein